MLKQLLTIGLLATLFSACTDTRGTRIAYGNKGSEVFYTEHITADEAKRFGDFLDKTLDFFARFSKQQLMLQRPAKTKDRLIL